MYFSSHTNLLLLYLYITPLFCVMFASVLEWHSEAFDGVAFLKLDLNPYLTINVLETFVETLGIRNHHVDVAVVVLVVVGITVPGTVFGICVVVLIVVLGFKSVEGPCRVLAPD